MNRSSISIEGWRGKALKSTGWQERTTMHIARSLTFWFMVLGAGLPTSASVVLADAKIPLCHSGFVKLPSFDQHIEMLQSLKRYEPEFIEKLRSRRSKGGADFFSSQIFIQDELSGSGTFDLNIVHGFGDADQYRVDKKWTCTRSDYPIVYFVGFRVVRIGDGAVFVARDEGVVNVMSVKKINRGNRKTITVRSITNGKLLCEDIGTRCVASIFSGRE